jgi:hypothetical protein
MTEYRSSSDGRGGRIEGASFAPVRVAAGRGRPALVGALIAGSLAILIGLGTIGQAGSADPAVASKASGPAAVALPLPVPVPVPSSVPATADPFGVAISTTGSRITVTGTLGVHADLVTVTLETAAGVTADWMLLGVRNPDGAIRLDESPPFSAGFNLAKAVAASPLWVQVDAYNEAGARVASARQPVLVRWARVGPLGFRQR